MNAAAVAGILLLMYSKRTVPFLVNLVIRIGSRLRLIRDPGSMRTRLHESIRTYHEKTGYVKKNPTLFFKVLFVTMIQMTARNLVPCFVYCGLGFWINVSPVCAGYRHDRQRGISFIFFIRQLYHLFYDTSENIRTKEKEGFDLCIKSRLKY